MLVSLLGCISFRVFNNHHHSGKKFIKFMSLSFSTSEFHKVHNLKPNNAIDIWPYVVMYFGK